MTRVAFQYLILSLLGGAILATLWEVVSKGVVWACGRWAIASGYMPVEVKVPEIFVPYEMPTSLLAYVAARNGELLAQFTNPAATLAFYDFSLERIPKEKQVELARKLLKEYGILLGTPASGESPGTEHDLDTLRKLRFLLAKRLADLASQGVRRASEAIDSIKKDIGEHDLGQLISLYCQVA